MKRSRHLCVRPGLLRRVFRHFSLRRRLHRQPLGAQIDRLAARRRPGHRAAGESRIAGPVCRAAQRHGAAGLQALVDPHRAGAGRAQHLRAVLVTRVDRAFLVLAAHGRSESGNITAPLGMDAMYLVYAAGWALLLYSTFLINHFDLFGLRQVWLQLIGKPFTPLNFKTPWLYRQVRHPIYVALAHDHLGDTHHDRGAPGVRHHVDGLHPGRPQARRARPHRCTSRIRGVHEARAGLAAPIHSRRQTRRLM